MGNLRASVGVSAGVNRAETTLESAHRDGRVPPVYALVPEARRGAAAAKRIAEHLAEGESVPAWPAVEVDHSARRRRISRYRREAVVVQAREKALPPGPAAQVVAAAAYADACGRLVAAQEERDVNDCRRRQPGGKKNH